MRVTCVIHSLDGGGAERVMAALCSGLADRGHEVTLITLDDGRRERREVSPLVQRKRLDVMSQSPGWLAKLTNTRTRVKRLRDAISDTSPQVVLSFCDRTNVLTLMAASPTAVPVVVSERSDPAQQRLGPVWEWLRDRSYPRAAAIVALTDESANHLQSRFKIPIEVIPSAVDRPAMISDRKSAMRSHSIVAIGRLEYEKGFDRLLEAFAGLPAHCCDWSLQIWGEGSRRAELDQQISSLGLRERVTMPGWIQPIEEALAAATMFVLPSRYEGFPSALMEAMAAGVPSLAVDCDSGPRAVICDPTWALLVPNHVDSLRHGIERLIGEPEYREQLGVAGKQVTEKFSWEAMADRYEDVLTQYAVQPILSSGNSSAR